MTDEPYTIHKRAIKTSQHIISIELNSLCYLCGLETVSKEECSAEAKVFKKTFKAALKMLGVAATSISNITTPLSNASISFSASYQTNLSTVSIDTGPFSGPRFIKPHPLPHCDLIDFQLRASRFALSFPKCILPTDRLIAVGLWIAGGRHKPWRMVPLRGS